MSMEGVRPLSVETGRPPSRSPTSGENGRPPSRSPVFGESGRPSSRHSRSPTSGESGRPSSRSPTFGENGRPSSRSPTFGENGRPFSRERSPSALRREQEEEMERKKLASAVEAARESRRQQEIDHMNAEANPEVVPQAKKKKKSKEKRNKDSGEGEGEDEENEEEEKAKNLAAQIAAEAVAKKWEDFVNNPANKYEDGRTIYKFAVERNYFYHYTKTPPVFRCSFVTPPGAKIQGHVFREVEVPQDLVEDFKVLQFQSDRTLMPINDELRRRILNRLYCVMKESAEKELYSLQNLTAGVGVFRAVQRFEPPKGYEMMPVKGLPPPSINAETNTNTTTTSITTPAAVTSPPSSSSSSSSSSKTHKSIILNALEEAEQDDRTRVKDGDRDADVSSPRSNSRIDNMEKDHAASDVNVNANANANANANVDAVGGKSPRPSNEAKDTFENSSARRDGDGKGKETEKDSGEGEDPETTKLNFAPVLDHYPVQIEDFPYNFGVRCKKIGVPSSIFFFCLANDRCRLKPTILELKLQRKETYRDSMQRLHSIKVKEDADEHARIIEEHLKEKHWNALVQTHTYK